MAAPRHRAREDRRRVRPALGHLRDATGENAAHDAFVDDPPRRTARRRAHRGAPRLPGVGCRGPGRLRRLAGAAHRLGILCRPAGGRRRRPRDRRRRRGAARLGPTRDNPRGTLARVANVFTDEAWRRRGVARALLRAVLAHCEAAGVREFNLGATAEAAALYASLGFTAYPAEMRRRAASP
jgi:GNAT superfamily N-acetyltransferase